MIVESDELDQIFLIVLLLLQFLVDDLRKPIDDKLLPKWRLRRQSFPEVLISLRRVILLLHIEECEGELQFSAFRVFFYPVGKHPLNLLEELLTAVFLLFFASWVLDFVFQWAILL